MGSPRKQGNTAALLRPFSEELALRGHEVETVPLYERDIRPCVACLKCQEDWNDFGCSQWDDVPQLFHRVLDCDLLVLATPIYAWYCTPLVSASTYPLTCTAPNAVVSMPCRSVCSSRPLMAPR